MITHLLFAPQYDFETQKIVSGEGSDLLIQNKSKTSAHSQYEIELSMPKPEEARRQV